MQILQQDKKLKNRNVLVKRSHSIFLDFYFELIVTRFRRFLLLMEEAAADSTKGKKGKKQRAPRVVWVNLNNTSYLSVRQCVEDLGYRITESSTKNLLFWCDSGGTLDFASSLEAWQFYNHFPGMWSIARKVELARNIDRMSRILPDVYNFHPKTFLLPSQFSDMRTYVLNIPKKSKRTFIIKPDRGAQGKGIVLIQDPDQMEDYLDMAVAQQYIPPFLIDGYKFDLRIYVLVTSVDPLRIYILDEGMARFCTEPYQKPKGSNLSQVYCHLTNYSLNKKNEDFDPNSKPTDAPENETAFKRSLTSILKEVDKQGHDSKILMKKIDEILRLTMASVQPFLASNYHVGISTNDGRSRCFEILGFDIFIDKNVNPWLLEVNFMPSLTCDSEFDRVLKFSVIQGALKILNLTPNFKKLVMNRLRAISQKRISGTTNLPIYPLFDPQIESDIAKTTRWRQLYPLLDDVQSNIEIALTKSKANPVGAAVETQASRARKEAIIKQREKEMQPPKRISRRQPSTKQQPLPPLPEPPESSSSTSTTNANQTDLTVPDAAPTQSRFSLPVRPPKRTNLASSCTQTLKELPLFVQFCDSVPNVVDESEENARVQAIRNQQMLSQSLNLPQEIRSYLHSIGQNIPEEQPRNRAESLLKQQKFLTKVMRPIVVYKQVIVSEMHTMKQ